MVVTPAAKDKTKETPSKNTKKVALSSLVGQAREPLQGGVLEEIGKKVEELAQAERETCLGRFPGLVSSEPSARGVGLYLLGAQNAQPKIPNFFSTRFVDRTQEHELWRLASKALCAILSAQL